MKKKAAEEKEEKEKKNKERAENEQDSDSSSVESKSDQPGKKAAPSTSEPSNSKEEKKGCNCTIV